VRSVKIHGHDITTGNAPAYLNALVRDTGLTKSAIAQTWGAHPRLIGDALLRGVRPHWGRLALLEMLWRHTPHSGKTEALAAVDQMMRGPDL
jgi:hypothetical protein